MVELNDHGLDDQQLTEVLTYGELNIEGRLIDASNLAVVAVAHLDGATARCVYKPSAGERPLWDFDTATLSRREVAAYQVSAAAGWNLVPVTVWRDDGPAGEGMCQVWIDVDEDAALVDIVPRGAVPPGWKHVIDAEGSAGRPVTLVHADHKALKKMAAFDAAVNNADRKGGHILVDPRGRVFGIDHGVTFHEEDKLRTVLWGWSGEPLEEENIEALARLNEAVHTSNAAGLRGLLSRHEIKITVERIKHLCEVGRYPYPGAEWPSLPWPAF